MTAAFLANTVPLKPEGTRLVSLLREVNGRLDADDIQRIETIVFTVETVVPDDLETVVILGSQSCGYRVERALNLTPLPERRYVVSGGNLMGNGMTEAVNMEVQLVAGGVWADLIVKETKAQNTRQNLELILPWLKRMASKRIGLITGGFHMRRTLRAAAEIFAVLPDHVLYPISAFGPHTSPGSWSKTKTGRFIMADELEKILDYRVVASRP
jgi:hypothetical protein